MQRTSLCRGLCEIPAFTSGRTGYRKQEAAIDHSSNQTEVIATDSSATPQNDTIFRQVSLVILRSNATKDPFSPAADSPMSQLGVM